MRHSGSPGATALLAVFLSACTGGLYTAEGLPPLNGGGGKNCDPNTQLDCPGVATCVDRDATQCEACGTPCPTVANAIATCGAPAGTPRACRYTCNPGWLSCRSGCCRAVTVAAGGDHTCAVTDDATLRCWGANGSGQVTRTSTSVSEPLPVTVVSQGAGFVLAAGFAHTCAVVNGAVQCWGANGAGQATVPSLTGTVTGLAAGQSHTCAIAGGAVTCWGDNTFNQTTISLSGLSPAARIVAGANHTCTLDGGAVRCWGQTDKLGGGSPFAAGIVAIAAGHGHTCASDGSAGGLTGLYCWGSNPGGVVLPGLPDPQPTPAVPPKEGGSGQNIVGSKPVVFLAAGRAHTCAVLASVPAEPAVCFGDNAALQLGNVTPAPQSSATIAGLTVEPRLLSSGAEHSCAITAESELKCWGRNDLGQLGDGTTQPPGTGAPGAVFVSGR